MEVGLLVLRLVVGLILAAHGAQKLFGWFGGYGLAGTGGWLESIGFRPGKLQAAMAGGGELVGGLLLALGLATPLAAAMIIGVMLVAAVSVHLQNGFWITAAGYEYNVVLAGAAFALALTGPGALSLDAALGLGLTGWQWGVGALVAGLVGGAGALATRVTPSTVTAT